MAVKTFRVDLRASSDTESLEALSRLLRQVSIVLDESDDYQNRPSKSGKESLIHRRYFKIEFNGEVSDEPV